MNRVKLWVYVVLAVGSGALFLRSSSIDAMARARAGIDRRLTTASTSSASALHALDGQAAAIAVLAAADPGLQQATLQAAEPLSPPRGKRPASAPVPDEATREQQRLAAARAAASSAAVTVGLPRETRVEVWTATGAELAEGAQGNPAVWDLLTGAAAGKARSGRVIVDELVWTVAVAPLGNGGAIAVALPLDAAWAAAVGASTGVDVSVAAPGAKTVTTARPQEAKAIVEAGARAPRAFSDAGRLAPVPLQLPVPLPVPDAAPLFGAAPAQRVHAIPVDGLKGAQLVLSAATGAELVPLVREQWTAVFGLAALLVLGLLFGLLIRGEVSARIPAELVAAAARIEKGEFTARAPALAGKLGTVAAALNAAAEAAGRAAAEPSAPAPVEAGPNAFQLPSRPEPALEPLPPADPFAAAPALPADPAFTQPLSAPPAPERSDASGLLGGAFEAAPVRNPPAPEPVMPGPTPATPADLLLGAAKAAAPEAAADDDEAHWREVFEDFLRIRRECGEAADGLSYERFRAKLEKNRDQLVAKYACRTVRFHVYVKDGKAALKATPVRSA